MECTIPRPTLENPIPAIYCPSAMPLLFPQAYCLPRPPQASGDNLIAFRWNISESSRGAGGNVTLNRFVGQRIHTGSRSQSTGMVDIISGSTNATTGISSGSTQTIFRFFFSAICNNVVDRNFCRFCSRCRHCENRYRFVFWWSRSSQASHISRIPGWLNHDTDALAVSREDPPPMAIR